MASDSIGNGRQDPRVSYHDPVQVSLIGHPEQVRYLLAEDLSLGGLKLLSAEPYPLHAHLLMDIETTTASEPIRVVGQVVWYARVDHQERYRMGVRLMAVDDVARERLRDLVAARVQVTE